MDQLEARVHNLENNSKIIQKYLERLITEFQVANNFAVPHESHDAYVWRQFALAHIQSPAVFGNESVSENADRMLVLYKKRFSEE